MSKVSADISFGSLRDATCRNAWFNELPKTNVDIHHNPSNGNDCTGSMKINW
jgi:hypothetical protein